MPKYFIITVGTSTFTNIIHFVQNKELLGDCPTLAQLFEIFRAETDYKGHISPIMLAGFIENHRAQVAHLQGDLIDELNYLFENQYEAFPTEMSAEISSLMAYREVDNFQNDETQFIFNFIQTDTFVGEVCGRILQSFYELQNIETNLTKINGLHLNVESMADAGLYNFAKKLFELIVEYKQQNWEVIVIGTGGFKAQIPYTSLLAVIFHISVYYYHQLFNDIVKLPNIPIVCLDTTIISQNKGLFSSLLHYNLPVFEFEQQWNPKSNENVKRLLLEEIIINDQKYVRLNNIGRLFVNYVNNPGGHANKINIAVAEELAGNYFFQGEIEPIKKENPSYLIFTVGTSLFTQAINFYKTNPELISQKSPFIKIIKQYENQGDRKDFLPLGIYALEQINKWESNQKNPVRRLIENDIITFIEYSADNGSLQRTSAELNTLIRLIKEQCIDKDNVSGIFLSSDTYLGNICGNALAKYCNQNFANNQNSFQNKRVKNLSYQGDQFVSNGLRNLIQRIVDLTLEIEQKQNRQILFCATGGFKAETAHATLLGMILGKPIFYIHENHRSLLRFQLFPIVLNYSKIIMYFDHLFNLQWEQNEETYQKYAAVWSSDPQEGVKENMELFFQKTPEGAYKLNLAGIAILEILKKTKPFSELNAIENKMIDSLSCSNKFRRENPANFQIDWNKSGGHPPQPAGWSGDPPLRAFLKPFIERTYVNEIKSQIGGIETKPLNIKISRKSSWSGYLPNNGGAHVQVAYNSNTLVLTIAFSGDVINKNQIELKQRFNTRIMAELRRIFQEEFIREKIQIKLPDNYLGPRLLERLMALVRENA